MPHFHQRFLLLYIYKYALLYKSTHWCFSRNFRVETVFFLESPGCNISKSIGSGLPCPIPTSAFCIDLYCNICVYQCIRTHKARIFVPQYVCVSTYTNIQINVVEFLKALGQVFHVPFPLVLSVFEIYIVMHMRIVVLICIVRCICVVIHMCINMYFQKASRQAFMFHFHERFQILNILMCIESILF